MKRVVPKFGDIFYASLTADGCVQGGKRPVLIAQNDIGNLHSPVVGVIPLTSRPKKQMPTHVMIRASEVSGLKTDSVVLTEQIQTIKQSQLEFRIGELTKKELSDVGRAWNVQFPFPKT